MRKLFFSFCSIAMLRALCPESELRIRPVSIISVRSSAAKILSRRAILGHTPLSTCGIHTYFHDCPAAAAGVASVTAFSTGAFFDSESVAISWVLIYLINPPISELPSAYDDASVNSLITVSSWSLACAFTLSEGPLVACFSHSSERPMAVHASIRVSAGLACFFPACFLTRRMISMNICTSLRAVRLDADRIKPSSKALYRLSPVWLQASRSRTIS